MCEESEDGLREGGTDGATAGGGREEGQERWREGGREGGREGCREGERRWRADRVCEREQAKERGFGVGERAREKGV